MATPGSKLPAPVAPSRAPAAAVAKAAPPTAAGTAGTLKLLVWLLVALNVGAAGGWVYYKFFKNGDAERSLGLTRRRLVKLQTDLDVLNSTVRNIASSGINEVDDPNKLIGEVAQSFAIDDSISRAPVSEGKFHRTNYTEKSVKVTFLNKKGYKFRDFVSFLTALEAANPTVQIKDVDFGRRNPPTIGNDLWIPTAATVRVLQLTTAPGS